jgi:hypothetical protein
MQFALRIARVPELTLPDEEMLDPRRTTAYWAGLDGILDAMLAFERAPETCDFVILMTKEPEA